MQYIIVIGTNPNDLMARVNEFISRGYEPQGGVSTFSSVSTFESGIEQVTVKFAQAMVYSG